MSSEFISLERTKWCSHPKQKIRAKHKRMTSTPPSHAFDERLRNIFSFREIIPLVSAMYVWYVVTKFQSQTHDTHDGRIALLQIDEHLASIQVNNNNPAFLFDWQEENLNAFVTAVNSLNPAQAPRWMRTRPPNITVRSFADDVISRLQPLVGGRFGHIMLAPNNLQQ